MKKLAIFIPTLTIGGAEKLALTLASSFKEDNLDVTLVVLSNKINVDFIYAYNCSYKSFPMSIIGMYHLFLFLYKSKFSSVLSLLERANLYNFLLSFFFKWNPILSVHTPPAGGFSIRSFKSRFFIRILYKSVSFFSKVKVVGVSQGICQELKELFNIKSVYFIPNPIDIEDIINKSKKITPQVYSNQVLNISYFGRLSEIKGVHYLIKSVVKAQNDVSGDKRFVIHLFGDGPEKNTLKQMVELTQVNVIFHGSVSNPYPYMLKADYIIVPSLFEGFGLVVVEALALKKKIIATTCKYGPREILSGKQEPILGMNEFGYLIPDFTSSPEDGVNQLSTTLNELVDLPKEYDFPDEEKLCSQAKKYSKNAISKLYMKII